MRGTFIMSGLTSRFIIFVAKQTALRHGTCAYVHLLPALGKLPARQNMRHGSNSGIVSNSFCLTIDV